jgi:epoxyqueuosine reductase
MDAARAAGIFREHALALGFQRVGFTPVGPVERHAAYRAWLKRGYAGEMAYLERDADARRDPRALLESARTLVSVALSYAHADPVDVPADRLARGPRGVIARYARGADYHAVVKDKLRALARGAAESLGRAIAYVPCVDTAPVLEREGAQAAGLGFIAKNTMLIAPGAGSWLVLGELLTDVECAPEPQSANAPASDGAPRCGECRRCLDACPTGAFDGAYSLDARRCISYLTIEAVGAIPRELRPLVGDRVFGCDVCQDVCPFNASAPIQKMGAPELAPRAGYGHPSLVRLLGLGAAQFRKWNARSALRRIHRAQLLRNVAVALGNVGGAAELPALARALDEKSPLVRAHAAWAVGEIARREPPSRALARALLERRRAVEEDAAAREELDAALAHAME